MSSECEIRLAIFDWAGTAVDFGCVGPAQAFMAAFELVGVPVTAAEARKPMGIAKKEHLRAMFADPAITARWTARTGKPPTEADVDRLYAEVTPRQIEAAGRLGAPMPGFLDCVAKLRQRGLKIAGTTGYFREAAQAAAATAARHGYVPDANVCADDVAFGRPAPFMIYRVMEATGVYPPSAVVKIGDTAADIAEGRNAGTWCVGVIDSSNGMGLTEAEFEALSETERSDRRTRVRDEFRRAGAHAVIESMEELPALIDQINHGLRQGDRPRSGLVDG